MMDTVNEHCALTFDPSDAVAVTVVVPFGNTVPGAWEYVIVGLSEQLSLATTTNGTAALQAFGAALTVMFAGHTTVGGVTSPTIAVPKAEYELAQAPPSKRARYDVVTRRSENDCVADVFAMAVNVAKLSVDDSQLLMIPVYPESVSVPELLPEHCNVVGAIAMVPGVTTGSTVIVLLVDVAQGDEPSVYVIATDPERPAGLKMPAGVTPVPLHVPPCCEPWKNRTASTLKLIALIAVFMVMRTNRVWAVA